MSWRFSARSLILDKKNVDFVDINQFIHTGVDTYESGTKLLAGSNTLLRHTRAISRVEDKPRASRDFENARNLIIRRQ